MTTENTNSRKSRPSAGSPRRERPNRSSPGGFRDILTVEGKDPAYKYRWVSDIDEAGARIWRMKNIGYEFAQAEGHQIGENAVFNSKSNGSVIRVPADKDGNFLYLMRIPREWYEEDKAAHERKIREIEKDLYRERDKDRDDGQYGSIDSTVGFARSLT